MTWARALVVAWLAAASAVAQTTGPARVATQRATGGAGSLGGRVVTDEPDARPVRRAIVSLTGDGLRPNRGVITDDDGRFQIADLPAGRFTLTASRASFITSAYGARRAGRPGTAVVLREGEALTDLVIRLWRGAAIAGVIRDETGAPVEGVPVTAIPARPPAGQSTLTLTNNGGVTNDQGEFRIFGLPPGSYIMSATPQTRGTGSIRVMTDANVDAALDSLNRRKPGTPPSASTASPESAARAFDYAPIYYPGTPSRAQATAFTLTAGSEQLGLDFTLHRVSNAALEGTVTRTDGQPAAGAAVQLVQVVQSGAFASPSQVWGTTAGPDGRFRIAEVPPGAYQLVARAALSLDQQRFVLGLSGPALWATTNVSVASVDVGGLVLTVQPARTVSGRVRFDGTSPTPEPGAVRLAFVPIGAVARPPGAPVVTLQAFSSAVARDDGGFELANVGPGTYRLQAGLTGVNGWWPRSAMLGSRDLLDGDIVVGSSADLRDVLLTFSDRRTALSGSLRTPTGAPVSGVFVIAFSADRQHWGAGSRRVQAVRPATDGTFTITGLPAGDYRLAAVTDVDPDEWQDPAFLTMALPASIPITLADGEAKTQNLLLGAP